MSTNISPPTIIDVLCATLERIEQSGEFDARDPAFIELKRSIARAIAEFEVAKTAKSEAEFEPPLLSES